MHFFHVKSHQTESSSLASADLQRKGVISLNYVCSCKEITPLFESLLKPNYCSQFDEILHEKIVIQDLLKTFFRINLSLLEAEIRRFFMYRKR